MHSSTFQRYHQYTTLLIVEIAYQYLREHNQNKFLFTMFDYQNSNTTSVTTVCNHCKSNLAEIFQENGDFCLHCWQEITCPNV
jgi:hypothetical protein